MSETKNDSEQVPEELDNQVDTVGEETSSESVTSLFQRLRVVPLGNRQNPIGSANIEYRGLFVTADEHAVLESGNPSNTAWIMGFMIDPHRGYCWRRDFFRKCHFSIAKTTDSIHGICSG